MIVRQRNNLNQTFTAQEQQPLATSTAKELHTNQSELLEKTNEFAQGLAARGAALPGLTDAVAQMQSALQALDVPELSEALTSEQQALASLIRARQNMRKMLSQSSSQSAAA